MKKGYSYDAQSQLTGVSDRVADLFYTYTYDKARYYDPEIGRLISADKVVLSGGGDIRVYNLYSYSFNNSVNMSNPGGNWPKWVSKIGNVIKNTVKKAVAKIKKKTYSVYYNATKRYFEDRAKKNGKHPSYIEVEPETSAWSF